MLDIYVLILHIYTHDWITTALIASTLHLRRSTVPHPSSPHGYSPTNHATIAAVVAHYPEFSATTTTTTKHLYISIPLRGISRSPGTIMLQSLLGQQNDNNQVCRPFTRAHSLNCPLTRGDHRHLASPGYRSMVKKSEMYI